MKISDKEKKMLFILFLFILGYAYYSYFYTPQKTKLETLKQTRNEKEIQAQGISVKVADLPKKQVELENLQEDRFELAKKNYGDVKQEEIILLINNFEKESDIYINTISFSEPDIKETFFNQELIKKIVSKQILEEGKGSPENSTENKGETPQEGETATTEEKGEGFNLDGASILKDAQITVANINFFGTYKDLTNLIDLLEKNNKNIVFEGLSIRKESRKGNVEGKNSEDAITGELTLEFLKFPYIDKYIPPIPSILEKNPLKKTDSYSPIIAYNYVNKEALDDEVGKDIITIKNLNTYEAIDNTVQTIFKKELFYKKQVELLSFDNLNELSLGSTNEKNKFNMDLKDVEEIGYKIIKLDLEFDENSKLNDKIELNLKPKNIVINEKIEDLKLNIYSPNDDMVNMGVKLIDAENKEDYIEFSAPSEFRGWKEIEANPGAIKYPVTIDSIYFTKKDNFKNKEIYLDSLYAEYSNENK